MTYSYQYPRAALTVDCVVFGLDEADLKVLRQVVSLWCYRGRPDAATQLAASEGMAEYLPTAAVEDALDEIGRAHV